MVKETYNTFAALFEQEVATPMDAFFVDGLKQDNIWAPLRKNAKTPEQFLRACSEKVDGLRILQFLKYAQKEAGYTNEECLPDLFQTYHKNSLGDLDFLKPGFRFNTATVKELDLIRNTLVNIEENYQKENHIKS
jgi:hypothetical protein